MLAFRALALSIFISLSANVLASDLCGQIELRGTFEVEENINSRPAVNVGAIEFTESQGNEATAVDRGLETFSYASLDLVGKVAIGVNDDGYCTLEYEVSENIMPITAKLLNLDGTGAATDIAGGVTVEFDKQNFYRLFPPAK